ncbi:hypothetical protein [Aliihoeflea sp. PC F10.4]
MVGTVFAVRGVALSALVVMAVGLSGCGTATSGPATAASTASTGSGVYPNLNVPMTPATAQLTPEERAETAADLRGRRQTGGSPAPGSSSADDLRRIGSTHAQDAIRRIESE